MADENNWIEFIISAMKQRDQYTNIVFDSTHDRSELYSRLDTIDPLFGCVVTSYANSDATMDEIYYLPDYKCYVFDITQDLNEIELKRLIYLAGDIGDGYICDAKGKLRVLNPANVWIFLQQPLNQELRRLSIKFWTIMNNRICPAV